MLIQVTWINGAEMELQVDTLRELDTFLGAHLADGIIADLKPYRGDGLRLIFNEAVGEGAGPTARSSSSPR